MSYQRSSTKAGGSLAEDQAGDETLFFSREDCGGARDHAATDSRLPHPISRGHHDDDIIMSPLSVDVDEGDLRSSHTPESRQLGTLQLAVIMFYTVSGGPFGVEASVRAGGVFFTLLGFIVLSLVWSLPEALVTAELGSTFPEPSGSVAWVEEAFGNAAGWIVGYLSWVSGATDSTIYPSLFLDYFLQIVSTDAFGPLVRYGLAVSLSTGLTAVNYFGLNKVSDTSILICVVSMSPFVLAVVLGIPHVNPRRWLQFPEVSIGSEEDSDESSGILPTLMMGGVFWRPFLNNMFWNLNSFDSGACFSAEVDNPGITFPRAMFWSVLFVFLAYFIPLLVLLGMSDAPQDAWEDGYVASVISEKIGLWLGYWTVFAAGVSNIALFQAEMSSDAYMLMGMADRGHLCSLFGRRSRFGTPTYGLLAGLAVVFIFSVSDFSTLVEMLNFNYGVALLVEYAAFLKLRVSRPDVHRPYRIPLNTLGCCAALLPAVSLTLLVLLLASVRTWTVSILSILIGAILYRASCTTCRRQCCYYTSIPADDNNEHVQSKK